MNKYGQPNVTLKNKQKTNFGTFSWPYECEMVKVTDKQTNIKDNHILNKLYNKQMNRNAGL
jgi:hypothetical protein